MKKLIMKLPAKRSTKRCWLGAYGGHFDIVVVFKKEPVLVETWWDPSIKHYDKSSHLNEVAGVFNRDDFNDWFGIDIKPTSTEIFTVDEFMLEACWDDNGDLVGLYNKAD